MRPTKRTAYPDPGIKPKNRNPIQRGNDCAATEAYCGILLEGSSSRPPDLGALVGGRCGARAGAR